MSASSSLLTTEVIEKCPVDRIDKLDSAFEVVLAELKATEEELEDGENSPERMELGRVENEPVEGAVKEKPEVAPEDPNLETTKVAHEEPNPENTPVEEVGATPS